MRGEHPKLGLGSILLPTYRGLKSLEVSSRRKVDSGSYLSAPGEHLSPKVPQVQHSRDGTLNRTPCVHKNTYNSKSLHILNISVFKHLNYSLFCCFLRSESPCWLCQHPRCNSSQGILVPCDSPCNFASQLQCTPDF